MRRVHAWKGEGGMLEAAASSRRGFAGLGDGLEIGGVVDASRTHESHEPDLPASQNRWSLLASTG